MQITRDNYQSYSNMIQQMLGGGAASKSPDPYGTDYGNYSLRFTPTDRPFNPPDWNEVKTKQDKPAMSEAEFEEAIKELARKNFTTGTKDHKAIQKLIKQYIEVASPDRKAMYETSMRKTGGKMNAACMFYDSAGNKSLLWHPMTGKWSTIGTEEEHARAVDFYSIYNDEFKRLKNTYGAECSVTMRQIHNDLGVKELSVEKGLGEKIDKLI